MLLLTRYGRHTALAPYRGSEVGSIDLDFLQPEPGAWSVGHVCDVLGTSSEAQVEFIGSDGI